MSVTVIRQSDGVDLVFDGSPRQNYYPEIDIPRHPLEEGFEVTDHAIAEPFTFTVSGIITESPYQGIQDGGSAINATGGPQRIADAMNFLEESPGEFMTVIVPKLGSIDDCLLVSYPMEVTQLKEGRIDLTFIRPIIAEMMTMGDPINFVASPYQNAMAATLNAGVQSPGGASPSVTQQGNTWVANVSSSGAISNQPSSALPSSFRQVTMPSF